MLQVCYTLILGCPRAPPENAGAIPDLTNITTLLYDHMQDRSLACGWYDRGAELALTATDRDAQHQPGSPHTLNHTIINKSLQNGLMLNHTSHV